MRGKISFHFDDGHISHYEKVFPIFKKYGYVGCLCIMAGNYDEELKEHWLEMQEAGWEIISHSVTHIRMSEPLDEKTAEKEIIESKHILENDGFKVRQFVTPCSQMHPSLTVYAKSVYDAAFTRYTRATELPVEKLVIERPVNAFDLHRTGLAAKTLDELKAYVDYVYDNDEWMVFYDHDLGVNNNITEERLDALLCYIKQKNVAVMTSSEALDTEKCVTKILREGWNGEECYVHARIGTDGKDRMLISTQKMTVKGCDYFHVLETMFSSDRGRTWTDLVPNKTYEPRIMNDRRYAFSDNTPMFHKHTGKFIVTGHMAVFEIGALSPVDKKTRLRSLPYSVYDEKTRFLGEIKILQMPEPERFTDMGSGCSQCYELDDGDILMPISNLEVKNGVKQNATVRVLRLSFDGETLKVKEVGNELFEPVEGGRGIGEASLMKAHGRFFLTIRGDDYGFISVSDDGVNYTQPIIWRWDNGETVPTYNTQSHLYRHHGDLYLVYTRKNGTNDHVFRHRAPLYACKVDTERLCLIRDTEFVVVPERGARLGNFGVCTYNDDTAYVLVTEWMQPEGCEKYGSDNAVWLTKIQ